MNNLGVILIIVGSVIAGLATVTGIGYGLYLWGALGGALGVSMWTAFVLWLQMIVGGFVIAITGLLMEAS